MNLYAFIASLVGSLAWPLLVAWLVILLLRSKIPLEGVIENIRKYLKTIKLGPLEVTLQDAREAAEEVAVHLGQPLSNNIPRDDRLVQQAELNPALAVVDIYRELEQEIIGLVQHNGMMRFSNPTKFMRVLVQNEKISKSEYALFEKLRQIRNEAVHSRDPRPLTVAEVLEYRSFVSTLLARFEQIKAEPGYITVPLDRNPDP